MGRFSREYRTFDFLSESGEAKCSIDFFGELLKALGYKDMRVIAEYDRVKGALVYTATWGGEE